MRPNVYPQNRAQKVIKQGGPRGPCVTTMDAVEIIPFHSGFHVPKAHYCCCLTMSKFQLVAVVLPWRKFPSKQLMSCQYASVWRSCCSQSFGFHIFFCSFITSPISWIRTSRLTSTLSIPKHSIRGSMFISFDAPRFA